MKLHIITVAISILVAMVHGSASSSPKATIDSMPQFRFTLPAADSCTNGPLYVLPKEILICDILKYLSTDYRFLAHTNRYYYSLTRPLQLNFFKNIATDGSIYYPGRLLDYFVSNPADHERATNLAVCMYKLAQEKENQNQTNWLRVLLSVCSRVGNQYDLLFGRGIFEGRLDEAVVTQIRQIVLNDRSISLALFTNSLYHLEDLKVVLKWDFDKNDLMEDLANLLLDSDVNLKPVIKVIADSIDESYWQHVSDMIGAPVRKVCDTIINLQQFNSLFKVLDGQLAKNQKLRVAAKWANVQFDFYPPHDFYSDYYLLFDEAICKRHGFAIGNILEWLKGVNGFCRLMSIVLENADLTSAWTITVCRMAGEQLKSFGEKPTFEYCVAIEGSIDAFEDWDIVDKVYVAKLAMGCISLCKTLKVGLLEKILHKKSASELIPLIGNRSAIYRTLPFPSRASLIKYLSKDDFKTVLLAAIADGNNVEMRALYYYGGHSNMARQLIKERNPDFNFDI